MALHRNDPAYCPAPAYATEPVLFLDRKSADLVSPPTRPECGHPVTVDCEVDGCPFCRDALEQKPWIEPCATCTALRAQAFRATVALSADWSCELADCLHCSSCGLCCKSGRVCRRCGLCIEDQEESGECARQVWSKARRREVDVYEHSLLDPATGRWSA